MRMGRPPPHVYTAAALVTVIHPRSRTLDRPPANLRLRSIRLIPLSEITSYRHLTSSRLDMTHPESLATLAELAKTRKVAERGKRNKLVVKGASIASEPERRGVGPACPRTSQLSSCP